MPRRTARRLALCAVLALGFAPLLLAQKEPPPGSTLQTQTFEGQVVPLSDVLEKFGSRLDKDAAPHWLALATAGGKVYPLIKDAGARMFFKDSHLLRRPMRVTGRLYPGTHLLQVVQVHSLHKGKLHEVYYWCEVCAIRRNEKDICDCCGGPMELQEPPVRK